MMPIRVLQLAALGVLCAVLAVPTSAQEQDGEDAQIQTDEAGHTQMRIVSHEITEGRPLVHGALYPEATGRRLLRHGYVSEDNGATWEPFTTPPDFAADLPHGYRRNPVTSALDPNTGRLITIVNSMDTPGLDPKAIEPPIARETYYLRYRVSDDGGRSWLFEERIIHEGDDFTPEHPFEGIDIGSNGFFLGDAGCIPIITQTGRILVPVQASIQGEDGELFEPYGQKTGETFVIRGTWTDDAHIRWEASHRVHETERSTRGMLEPTLAQFADGRILMVTRGSNAAKPDWPARRWHSISENDGETWSDPEPWTWDDGEPFYSPSSMSVLIKHSSGRVFWVGNISEENCYGNSPRWPVIFAEVDPDTLTLIRDSALVVDTKRPEDEDRGRLDLCHFRALEDRETGEIMLTYPRAHNKYQSREWANARIAVE